MANEALATSAFIAVGAPLVLYWLVVGIVMIRRDASDRLSHHASTLKTDHDKLKAAKKEGKLGRIVIKEKWIVILIYITLMYEFIALSSFSFLPRVPWNIDVNIKNVITIFIIELDDMTFATVFWSVISVYALLALGFAYSKRFSIALRLSRAAIWIQSFAPRTTGTGAGAGTGTGGDERESDGDEDGEEEHDEELKALRSRSRSSRSLRSQSELHIQAQTQDTKDKEKDKDKGGQDKEKEKDKGKDSKVKAMLRKALGMGLRLGPQILLEIGFIPSSRMALSTLRCTYTTAPEGRPFLDSMPGLICWQGAHWAYVIVAVAFLMVLYPAALYFALVKNSLAQKIQFVPRFNVIFVMASLLICGVSTLLSTVVTVSQSVVLVVLACLLVYNVMSQPALGKGVVFNHWKSASLCGAAWAACIAVVVVLFTNNTTGDKVEWSVWVYTGGVLPLMAVSAVLSVWRNRMLERKALQSLESVGKDVENASTKNGRSIAVNIANLAINAHNREKIVASGGIEALLELCKSADVLTVQHAARALANLSVEDPLTRIRIMDIHGAKTLIETLGRGDLGPEEKNQLVRVLFHISLTKSLREPLVKLEIPAIMARNLNVPGGDTLAMTASKTLLSLSHSHLFQETYLKVPELQPQRFLGWLEGGRSSVATGPMGLGLSRQGKGHTSRDVRVNLFGVFIEMLQDQSSAGVVLACGGAEIVARALKSKHTTLRKLAERGQRLIKGLGVDASVELDREIRRTATFRVKDGDQDQDQDQDQAEGGGGGSADAPSSVKLHTRAQSLRWFVGKGKGDEKEKEKERGKDGEDGAPGDKGTSATAGMSRSRSATTAALPMLSINRKREDGGASAGLGVERDVSRDRSRDGRERDGSAQNAMPKRSRSVRWGPGAGVAAAERGEKLAGAKEKDGERDKDKDKTEADAEPMLRSRSGTFRSMISMMRRSESDGDGTTLGTTMTASVSASEAGGRDAIPSSKSAWHGSGAGAGAGAGAKSKDGGTVEQPAARSGRLRSVTMSLFSKDKDKDKEKYEDKEKEKEKERDEMKDRKKALRRSASHPVNASPPVPERVAEKDGGRAGSGPGSGASGIIVRVGAAGAGAGAGTDKGKGKPPKGGSKPKEKKAMRRSATAKTLRK